jgi:HK97 family phage portal protein
MFGQPSLTSNPDVAMQVPTVWACVSLIANTIASLMLCTYRQAGDVPKKINDPALVQNPDPDLTQSEWVHQLLVSLLLRGNAYALKSGAGTALNLPLLNPDWVNVKVEPDGTVTYKVGPQQVDVTSRIWHLRGMTLPGHKVGLSVIGSASAALGVDISARKFAKDFYEGGGHPVGVLKSDQPINQEQAVTLKERFKTASANREPVAMGLGATYELLPIKAEESQFLKTQEFNIAQIARFFNVPAEMVGGSSGSSLTYSTVELNSINFLTYCIQPWLRRIEDALDQLLPAPQYVRFDVTKLLRTDAKTQAEVDAIRVASKVRAPSEIRTDLGYQPLTQAEKDELSLIPLTVTPNTGVPKALPNPPTQGAYDAPQETPPKKQGAA